MLLWRMMKVPKSYCKGEGGGAREKAGWREVKEEREVDMKEGR